MYCDNFIGKKVNLYRKQLNLTLKELSTMVDTSPGYLSDIEKGKNLLSIPKLIEICDAFNITLSDFFNDDSNAVVLTDELKSLVDSARHLSPNELKQFKTLIDMFNERG